MTAGRPSPTLAQWAEAPGKTDAGGVGTAHGWHQSDPAATPGHTTDKDDALRALQDLRLVRGPASQAEVNAARTTGATWAEIAGMLGVSVEAVQHRWPEE